MRSGITYAALLTAVSASAAHYADDLVARDHVAEYIADLVARSNLDASDEYLVARDYDDDYYSDDLVAKDDSGHWSDGLYPRHPDAEPILGFNHIGKWIGQAAGAVSGGYKSRSNGKHGQYAKNKGDYGRNQDSYNSYGGGEGGGGDLMRRGVEDYEELFYAREAEPEPEFEYYDEYLPYRRSIDEIEFQDELFYAREAEPEPVLGLNHVGKWSGQAVGSAVAGYKSRAGGKQSNKPPKADKTESGKSQGYAKMDSTGYGGGGQMTSYGGGGQMIPYGGGKFARRDAEDMMYEDDLYIREADAEAEPILGLNTVGKWVGQAVGSVAGGFRSKSGGKGGKEGKKNKEGKEGKAGKMGGGGGDMMGGGGYGGGGGGYGGGMQQGSFI